MTTMDEPPALEESTGAAAGSSAHAHDHPDFLAHHFENAGQQYEAAKLGMWLFLGTEFLLFGGLFCLYAVFRFNDPEMMAYGSQFLDVRWGATNTVILILSSLTMALAVSAAQLGRRRALIVLMSLTVLGGAGFMAIKYVEYRHKFHENLVWGTRFYHEPEHAVAHADEQHEEAPAGAPVGDVAIGKKLFLETCRACHGAAGEGIPGQGKDQRGSEFIAAQDDAELADFIRVGRMPFDPANTTGIQMPPKGGNPLLGDADLFDIVAYIRTFDAAPSPGEEPAGEGETPIAVAPDFFIPASSIPAPRAAPAGLAAQDEAQPASAEGPRLPDPRHDPTRPANAHVFFGIYFMMTGLHGLHVLAGMAVIGWLIWLAARGRFSAEYYTPVDLGGLYWHVVDIIWIFLFPLLYLIPS